MSDGYTARLRRLAAQRRSDTMLSGVRPASVREQLTALGATAGDDLPDLYGEGGPVAELELRYARAWRHRYGGTLFQQWPAALAALPGARVYPAPPHTHQFRFWLPYPAAALDAANLALAEEERAWFVGGWRDTDVSGLALAEVTVAGPARELDADAVADLAARFLRRVRTT